jgi:hypothetical protein
VSDTDLVERHRVEKSAAVDLTDPRLRAVWKQLMRRDRKTGRFLYQTAFHNGRGTAEERQQFAAWMLLSAACEPPPPAITRLGRDALRDEWRAVAARLRAAAYEAQRMGLRPEHILGTCPQIDSWIETANDLEAKAADLDRAAFVIDRDRGRRSDRALAVSLARMCQLLFGKVLPDVVSKLTEAATGRRVEAWRVADWAKSANQE